MPKKKEREPDFFLYSVEYSLDGDTPSESHFMGLNERDALKMFAYSLIKPLFNKRFKDFQVETFQNAFANAGRDITKPPDLIPVPEPLPELELPEIEEEFVDPQEDGSPESKNSKDESAGKLDENESVGENIFEAAQVIEKTEKPDPVAIHKAKMLEREAEIEEVKKKNDIVIKKHNDSIELTKEMMEHVNSRLEVLNFLYYNRWADRWEKLPFPPKEPVDDTVEESSSE